MRSTRSGAARVELRRRLPRHVRGAWDQAPRPRPPAPGRGRGGLGPAPLPRPRRRPAGLGDHVLRAAGPAVGGEADFLIRLEPRGSRKIYIEVGADADAPPSRASFRAAAAHARFSATRRRGATVRSSGRLFNEWLDKSRADLALLTTELPTGPYPYAGIPWFSTAFGRDAIVTSLQTLWLDPSLARGVPSFLGPASGQGDLALPGYGPGKIMHETRKGEMADVARCRSASTTAVSTPRLCS